MLYHSLRAEPSSSNLGSVQLSCIPHFVVNEQEFFIGITSMDRKESHT